MDISSLTLGTWRALLCSAALALTLGACGGGDDASAPPAPMIGAAGGTVTGPNGAQVVIPAGALAANTAIAVTASTTGNPAPPTGLMTVGPVVAFTPHGTSFAQAVTVTVPVDPSVPAGAAVKLYKTMNGAAGPWEEVLGATRSGNLVSAQVRSFSLIAPFISLQPADQSVIAPAAASFSVTALGTPPFAYRWEKSDDGGGTFAAAAGVNNTRTYTTAATSVAADNGDRYRVLVATDDNNNGLIDVGEAAATSNSAMLTVTAPAMAMLTVTTVGNGNVTSMPGGINCPGDCTESVVIGANVSLTAAPAAGSGFGGWSGDCTGTTAAAAVAMTAARACTATFTLIPLPATGTWLQLGGALDVGPASSGARDLFAAVALDLAGNPVVAWKGRVLGPGTSTNTIYVKRWDGANWVQLGANLLLRTAQNSGYLQTPSIDVDPTNGDVIVAWSEPTARTPVDLNGAFDVVVKRWNGAAWAQVGSALNVDAAATAYLPKVRVTNAGTPIVAWWESGERSAARMWNGSAWINFGASGYVSTIPVLTPDLSLTALTLDGSGNPFVVFGGSGGPFAAQGSGSGWTLLGGFGIRTSPAPAYNWSAATDAIGRTTVLLLTRDGLSTTNTATTLRVRQFDSGAWGDFGNLVLTADRNTVPSTVAIAIPYNTLNPIVSAGIGGPGGSPPGQFVQSFVQWNGAAWAPLAPNLSDPCELAVRANASTAVAAMPVVACVRSAGNEDIVVYRLVP